MKSFVWFIFAAQVSGCAPAVSEPSAPPPEETLKLKSLLIRQDASLSEWRAAKPAFQEACEVKVGDCRLLVGEKREEFLRRQGIATCKVPDADQEARCIADYRLKRGDINATLEYFTTAEWCLDQMLACIKDELEKSAADAKVSQALAREREVERGTAGTLAHARIGHLSEKINYLRATLPPDADHECAKLQDRGDCVAQAQASLPKLREEYEKSDSDFDAKRASQIYETETMEEAKCYAPEFECLNSRLEKYGEMAESRVVLDQVFATLEKRQQLVEKVGFGASVPCIDATTSDHQQEIIKAYQAYAREPVLYFRMQLHRAFLSLHRAQVSCLQDAATSAR